ncbi:MAG: hypothetical protein ACFB21_00515 [Opitutales bacterium]
MWPVSIALIALLLAILMMLGFQNPVRRWLANLVADADPYRPAFDAFQKALRRRDPAAMASLMAFPVKVDGDLFSDHDAIQSPEDLSRHFERLFPDSFRETLLSQSFNDVEAVDGGISIANGLVRMTASTDGDGVVTALQVTAMTVTAAAPAIAPVPRRVAVTRG